MAKPRPEPRIKLYYRDFVTEFEKYETEGQERHWHEEKYEIELVADGKGIHRLNDKEYELKRGLMFVSRLKDYHEMEITEKATIYRFRLPIKCMPERFVYSMLKNKANLITQMEEDMTQHLQNMFELLLSRPKAGIYDIQEIYMQEGLINIITMLFTSEVNRNPGDLYETELEKMAKVWYFLNDNFRRKLSVADVAAHFSMNPNYLNRVFVKKFGITVYAAIKALRLAYAAKLVEETEMRPPEICAACGYSGDANFSRDFKNKFGMSPTAYRKAFRAGTLPPVEEDVVDAEKLS